MPGGILAAGGGDVALAAAAAADRLGGVLDQVGGLDARRRARPRRRGSTPPVGRLAAEHDDVDARLVAHGEGEVAQVAGRRARRRAATTTPSSAAAASSPARPVASLARSALTSSLQRPDLVELALDAADEVVGRRADEPGGVGEHPLVALQQGDAAPRR